MLLFSTVAQHNYGLARLQVLQEVTRQAQLWLPGKSGISLPLSWLSGRADGEDESALGRRWMG